MVVAQITKANLPLHLSARLKPHVNQTTTDLLKNKT
jgi:hypothetical protein